MKGDRGPAVSLLKHRREQVLSRVLLHMIESPRPVNAAEDIRAFRATVDDVNDFLPIVANIQNVGVSYFAYIVGLATRSRIESGAIQNQTPDLRRNSGIHVRRQQLTIQDACGELFLEGIVVVDPVRLHK
jgi:hypothetical protein